VEDEGAEAVRELSCWKMEMAARDRLIEDRWNGLRKQYLERIERLERVSLMLGSRILRASQVLTQK